MNRARVLRAAIAIGATAILTVSSQSTALARQEADVTVMDAELQAWWQPAVSDGHRYAYVFAGQILRYDTVRDLVSETGVFPINTRTGSAVFDGRRYAYVFGGDDANGEAIQRYDVRTNSLTTMGASLPSPRGFTSAVWTGEHAYVFGGGGGGCDEDGCGHTTQIVRYTPATDTVTVMDAALPGGGDPNGMLIDTSAVWTGRYAFIFGGCCDFTDQIVRYDPSNDQVEVMSARLPTPRGSTTAVWDGRYAYVFGGDRAFNKDISQNEYYADIVRYDPASDTAELLDTALPSARQGSSAIWMVGRGAFVFGGFAWTPSTPDPSIVEIVRFRPGH